METLGLGALTQPVPEMLPKVLGHVRRKTSRTGTTQRVRGTSRKVYSSQSPLSRCESMVSSRENYASRGMGRLSFIDS